MLSQHDALPVQNFGKGRRKDRHDFKVGHLDAQEATH